MADMDEIEKMKDDDSEEKRIPSKRGRKSKLRKYLVAKALVEMGGNLSAVARKFGVARSRVAEFVGKRPDLQKILADTRDTAIDHAESSLLRAILQGEAWAVCFMLKTQGKSRGYVERQEILQNTRLTVSTEEMSDEQLARIAFGQSTGGGGGFIETTAVTKGPDRLLEVHDAGVQAGQASSHPERLHRQDDKWGSSQADCVDAAEARQERVD